MLNPFVHEWGSEEQQKLAFMGGVFYMLHGLALENLLKGVLVLQKHAPVLIDGRLNRYYARHKLAEYSDDIDAAEVTITPDERALLVKLEEYVCWIGRYPIPKKSADYKTAGSGNAEVAAIQALYDKLYEYIKRHGWVLKDEGRRLYLDPSIPRPE